MPRSKTSSATSPADRRGSARARRRARLRGFPPESRPDAHALVLGSMPGAASLAAGEYYAHPQNAFWRIMGALFGTAPTEPYAARVAALLDHGIALWDVLAACNRSGSLDTGIERGSMVVNDLGGFLARHGSIRVVYFNGSTAETLYRRHVLPALGARGQATGSVRLPSTSPAHATLRFAAKLEAWRVLARRER